MSYQSWQTGNVVLGQYRISGTLGEGGMGVVYQVHHEDWGVDLAMKCLRASIFDKAGGLENFVREAETWVNLALHPHVTSCYYVRMVDNLPLIFAEYVAGGSLADWIRDGRLYAGGQQAALERILDSAIQFAWGLHAAHEQGLVHQDVKPANVLMTEDGTVKVTDFGLAKARTLAGESALQGGEQQSVLVSVGGLTPAYCSPEQAQGQALSRKTDIWSWAVSLLHLFTGKVTWMSGVAAREVLARARAADERIPPMPAGVVRLLGRCFQAQPEQRPATMLEVARALQEIYAQETGKSYPLEMPQVGRNQAETLNNRALSLYDLGKVEQARQVWEQALQADPQHLESVYNRGVVLWRAGEITDDVLVQQLEMLRPAPAQAWRRATALAQVQLERGESLAAQALLEEAAHQAPGGPEIEEIQEKILAGKWAREQCQKYLKSAGGLVAGIGLSSDGRWLAYQDGLQKVIRLWIWDTQTGTTRMIVEMPAKSFPTFVLSPDGQWIVEGHTSGALILWDTQKTAQKTPAHVLQGHTSLVSSFSMSEDGRWLATCVKKNDWLGLFTRTQAPPADDSIRVWDLATGSCVAVFRNPDGEMSSVSLSKDGRWLISQKTDQTRSLWDIASKQCVATFAGPTQAYWASLSAFGPRMAVTDQLAISIWETGSGRLVHTQQNSRTSVARLSPDGYWLLTYDNAKKTRLWDVENGYCVHSFADQIPIGWCADGHRFATFNQYDQELRIWERSGTQRSHSPLRLSHIVTARESRLAEAQARALLRQARQALAAQHTVEALRLLHELRALPGWERAPEALEEYARVALTCERVSFRAAWEAGELSGHTSMIHALAMSADGSWMVSGGEDRTIRMWETGSGRCVRVLQGHTQNILGLAISADQTWIVSGGRDHTIRVWETASGRCVQTFSTRHAISTVRLSPDGRWIVAECIDDSPPSFGVGRNYQPRNRSLWLIERAGGTRAQLYFADMQDIARITLSRNNRRIITTPTFHYPSKERAIRVRNLDSERLVQSLQGHTSAVTILQVSPNGKRLLTGANRGSVNPQLDNTLRLWDLESGRELRQLQGHTMGICAASLSPDWRWLVSSSLDRTIRLWDLTSGACVHVLHTSEAPAQVLALSPNGRWLVAGGPENILQVWELDWELRAREQADWDEGARPELQQFLLDHIPYARSEPLPSGRDFLPQKALPYLVRQGMPVWSKEDFQHLLRQLQYVGYGWLRPEGIQAQLETMVQTRQDIPAPGTTGKKWWQRR